MTRLAIGAAFALLIVAGAAYTRSLTVENARLTANVAALEQQAAQYAHARAVAEREAARQAERAAELDAVRRAFIDGDFNAELPEDFRRALDQLLGRVRP